MGFYFITGLIVGATSMILVFSVYDPYGLGVTDGVVACQEKQASCQSTYRKYQLRTELRKLENPENE